MNKHISLLPFSYAISVLLIYPFLRKLLCNFQLSFFYLIFIYIVVGFFLNIGLQYLNANYDIFRILMMKKIFQYYIFYFLKIENFLRKNIFYICIFTSMMCTFFFELLVNDFKLPFHFSKICFLFIYYLFMIYIKIRVSVINHTILEINENDSLKWEKFISFYELKNTIIQSYNFKNILPFYSTNHTTKLNSNFFIKSFTGLFLGYYLITWYFNFTEKIDGSVGVRNTLVIILENRIKAIEHACSNETFDKSHLKQEMVCLQALKEKIQKLKLIFFLKKENVKKIHDITTLIRIYTPSHNSFDCMDELNSIIKTL